MNLRIDSCGTNTVRVRKFQTNRLFVRTLNHSRYPLWYDVVLATKKCEFRGDVLRTTHGSGILQLLRKIISPRRVSDSNKNVTQCFMGHQCIETRQVVSSFVGIYRLRYVSAHSGYVHKVEQT